MLRLRTVEEEGIVVEGASEEARRFLDLILSKSRDLQFGHLAVFFAKSYARIVNPALAA